METEEDFDLFEKPLVWKINKRHCKTSNLPSVKLIITAFYSMFYFFRLIWTKHYKEVFQAQNLFLRVKIMDWFFLQGHVPQS